MPTPPPDTTETHMVGVFASIEELVAMCVPFCDAGIRAGQPVVAALRPPHAEALRRELTDPARVRFVAHREKYRHPPGALQGLCDIARHHDGTDPLSPVRIVGEPPALTGLAQDGWLRYEASTNDALRGYALHRFCVYHRHAVSPEAEAELRRTHPFVVDADGTPRRNAGYQDPATFIATRQRVVRDPLEDQPPAVELYEPPAADTRQAVEAMARHAGLPPATTEQLVIAANEVVTNSIVHGRPPVTLRGWSTPGKVVVAVHDLGPGPCDPSAGLQPTTTGQTGLGLWIAHQLGPEIAMSRSRDGFTVRIGAAAHESADSALAT